MPTTVSSNLNVDNIVSALMKPYQQKEAKIQSDISSYEVKLSGVGKLKSSLSTLKSDLESVEANEKAPLTADQLKTALKAFVKDFNSTVTTTRANSDITIKRFTQKLRDEIDPVTSNAIGLSFDKTGQVQFDETKFDSLNSSDTATLNSDVNKLFDKALSSGSNINNLLMDGGKLDVQQATYNKKITQLNDKKDRLESQMAVYEANYRKQFTELQKALTVMDSNQDMMANLLKTSA